MIRADQLSLGDGLKASSTHNLLTLKLESTNPSLRINGSGELGAKIYASGGLQTNADGMSIKPDPAGGLETTADGLKIKASGVTDAMLANQYIYADGTRAMTGNLNLGGNRATGSASPIDGTDLANKTYVDNAVSGLSWKEPALVFDFLGDASSAPSSPSAGQSYHNTTDGKIYEWDGSQWVDMGAVANGTRAIVCGNGSTAIGNAASHENDVAEYNGTAWGFTSPSDGDAILINGNNGYFENQGYTYDSGTTSWIQFTGAGQLNAGDGLSKTGNTLNVNVDDSTIEISSDTLQVKDGGITSDKLADNAVTAAKVDSGSYQIDDEFSTYRYLIPYTNKSGSFQYGEKLTQSGSTAEGIFIFNDTVSIFYLPYNSTNFSSSGTITGTTSGATADANGTPTTTATVPNGTNKDFGLSVNSSAARVDGSFIVFRNGVRCGIVDDSTKLSDSKNQVYIDIVNNKVTFGAAPDYGDMISIHYRADAS